MQALLGERAPDAARRAPTLVAYGEGAGIGEVSGVMREEFGEYSEA
jgi:hypothetical protein